MLSHNTGMYSTVHVRTQIWAVFHMLVGVVFKISSDIHEKPPHTNPGLYNKLSSFIKYNLR